MVHLESDISMNLIKWDMSGDDSDLAPLTTLQKSQLAHIKEEVDSLDIINWNDNPSKVTSTRSKPKDDLPDGKIETYRQLLDTYKTLEAEYDLTKCATYFNYLEQLKNRTDESHNLCRYIERALDDFLILSKQYAIVSVNTMTLHVATEQLIFEQDKLINTFNEIGNYLKYFKEADYIIDKLELSNLSVRSDLFMQLTDTIESNIDFMNKNINFKEAKIYLVKYRHCQSKVINIMQRWIHNLLEETTESILNPTEMKSLNLPKQEDNKILGSTDTALALFYGRFQRIIPKIKTIIDIIEKKSVNNKDYENLLIDCQQFYLMKRGVVLGTSVRKGLDSIKNSYKGDHCSLVRQACALLLHASIDEYRLFYQFFTIKSSSLNGYLEGLCNALYDTLRPSIIHISHLETLAEICCILRIEMLEEHVQNNIECLEGFGNVCLQLLHDAQERLVFRAHVYLQSDVMSYNPSPGDLAYPEKLKMMEDIAETLLREEETRKMRRSSTSSYQNNPVDSPIPEPTFNNRTAATYEPIYKKSNTNNSPADLHGMWYPTVRRTLVCLSRLYRCVDRPVFQSLGREAITYCIESIEKAKEKITLRASQLDAELFQIKHLLILREQIAPFQVDFTVKEYSLDFSQVKTAAFGLFEKRSRLFTLSNNALLEFFLEGAPRMREHLIDSRKTVDVKLKLSCQQFIQHVTLLLVQPIVNLLENTKFQNLTNSTSDNNDIGKNNELNDPQKISAIISEVLRSIKFRLPNIQQSMQLYLANRETEFILFRPIRNNVVASFSQLHQLLQSIFTTEQLLLIACPLPEQISVMLSSTSLAHGRNSENHEHNNSCQSNDDG